MKTRTMSIYIASCAQISVQKPLSDEWFDNPAVYGSGTYVRAQDPDFKPFINPMAARRMGLILKRAIATSQSALRDAAVDSPDAIITATGLGCIENTEKFLFAMATQGESCLQPTFFINSTHNTTGSYIAVTRKDHCYNNTHVHRGTSFESALLDAVLKFRLGKIKTALVGAHDEMTPNYFQILDKIGFWDGGFAGETAVSFVLKDQGEIELSGMDIMYKPDNERIAKSLKTLCETKGIDIKDIDLLVTGRNGDAGNNSVYERFERAFGFTGKSATYKEIFGESFTTSGYGLCYAYECLRRRQTPDGRSVRNVLVYNHFNNIDHSLILLSR